MAELEEHATLVTFLAHKQIVPVIVCDLEVVQRDTMVRVQGPVFLAVDCANQVLADR
jgi:hypothetical protein